MTVLTKHFHISYIYSIRKIYLIKLYISLYLIKFILIFYCEKLPNTKILPNLNIKNHFFNCYLPAPWQTLGHSRGGSPSYLMLITVFDLFRDKGHWEPHNEAGSHCPAEHLGGFEPGTFQF